jgi:NADPH:quinone reductase-like Zn-dependent oxidoreductase
MKAFIQQNYGPPEQLTLTEVPVPRPKAGEVLVKIHSTAVNDYDWAMVTGVPRIYRLLYGLRRPKQPIPGTELSGTVASVGPGDSRFAPGDEVYGDISDHGFGTYAEYVCIKQEAMVPKPAEMSFDEAAAIPHATMLAWQGLVESGKLQPGERLLLNGGGGGVGTFALQMAKHIGARVTGVDTGAKLAKMRELGFDEVIDYKQEDFTRSGRQ